MTQKWVFRSSGFDVVNIFGHPVFGGGKSLGVWLHAVPWCFGISEVRRLEIAQGSVPYNSSVIRSSVPYDSYRLGVSDSGGSILVSQPLEIQLLMTNAWAITHKFEDRIYRNFD